MTSIETAASACTIALIVADRSVGHSAATDETVGDDVISEQALAFCQGWIDESGAVLACTSN